MRPYTARIVYALILLLALAYGYDYASVRRRMAAQKQGDPYHVITYPHLLAIPQKGNKVDYELDTQSPLVSESCVHSLFPHFGYTPCWYVQRRAANPTQMTILTTFGLSSTATLGCAGLSAYRPPGLTDICKPRTAKSRCATKPRSAIPLFRRAPRNAPVFVDDSAETRARGRPVRKVCRSFPARRTNRNVAFLAQPSLRISHPAYNGRMQRKVFWTTLTVLGLAADLALPFWWALFATIPLAFVSWWVAYRSNWF